MQTFLPYYNFAKCATCLDYKRLGKQRVEAKMILDILTGKRPKSRWRHHPAVKMWRGYEVALKLYMNYMIEEWEARGYKNNMIKADIRFDDKIIIPPWVTPSFVTSHRSNLLRKNPEYYSKFGWKVKNNRPYIWPEESNV